jgi:hypothetical protein
MDMFDPFSPGLKTKEVEDLKILEDGRRLDRFEMFEPF